MVIMLQKVEFVPGDVLDDRTLNSCPLFDAAFLDPDWADTGPDHVYRFRQSNTRPPADELPQRALGSTPNVAIVLPPLVDTRELEGLPEHERQKLCMGDRHELYCLYFGELIRTVGETEFHVR